MHPDLYEYEVKLLNLDIKKIIDLAQSSKSAKQAVQSADVEAKQSLFS